MKAWIGTRGDRLMRKFWPFGLLWIPRGGSVECMTGYYRWIFPGLMLWWVIRATRRYD